MEQFEQNFKELEAYCYEEAREKESMNELIISQRGLISSLKLTISSLQEHLKLIELALAKKEHALRKILLERANGIGKLDFATQTI